jgi:hypothetical protein
MRKATLLGNWLATSNKVRTFYFQLDCHVIMLIYYESIQYTSKRICDFYVYASVLSRGLIFFRLRFWTWTAHWWLNEPCLCHSSTGDTTSQFCAKAPLVIHSDRSVPQLHCWQSQPGLCSISATHFSPWRHGFAPEAVHMQYDVDSVGGTGFRLKYFLCRHHTMTIFPFICYLQDVYWACARLVVWRHTRACTLKQQCAWSDEHLQPCCAMRVSQQLVPFLSGFFSSHVCGWQTFLLCFILHYFYFQTWFISVFIIAPCIL